MDDNALKSINRAHATYGFFAIQIKPPGDLLFVEYDAARLSLKEVRGTLEEHGLPVS